LEALDFIGAMEVKIIEGKGRALVATEDIPAGSMLLAEKAFAVGGKR
jgi:hypothetical protein